MLIENQSIFFFEKFSSLNWLSEKIDGIELNFISKIELIELMADDVFYTTI